MPRGHTRTPHRGDLDGCLAVHENDHPDAIRLCLLVFGDAFAGCGLDGLVGLLAETFTEVHVVGGARGVDPAQVARNPPRRSSSIAGPSGCCSPPPPDEMAAVFGDERLRIVDTPPVPPAVGDVVREELIGVETYALRSADHGAGRTRAPALATRA